MADLNEPEWMREAMNREDAVPAPAEARAPQTQPRPQLRAVGANEVKPPTTFQTRVGSSIAMKAATFVWKNRLQIGEYTLIDGEPMEGKSTLVLGLAARMSRGQPMPFDDTPYDAKSVVFFGPEEDISQAGMPRFVAAGGDPAKFVEIICDANSGAQLSFPSGAKMFDDTLTKIEADGHAIGLVVVDGMAILVDRTLNENSNSDVTRAMQAMLTVLRKHHVALIGLRWLGKTAHDDVADRGIGAKAFRGMARGQIIALPHPEDVGKKVLLWTKHTGSKEEPRPIVYEIQSGQVALTDGSIGSFGVVEFIDELQLKAREVAEQVAKRKQGTASRTEVKQAEDFLRTELADGVMRSYADLVKSARKQFRLPQDAIFRAKMRLTRDGTVKSEPDRQWTGDPSARPWLMWIPILGQEPKRATSTPVQAQLPLTGGEVKS